LPVDFGELQAPDLTQLLYSSCTKGDSYRTSPNPLSSLEIMGMSNFTSLKCLELQNWFYWKDLSPLKLLSQLESLSCTDYGTLVDILAPGCLLALRSVTLDPLLESSEPWWLRSRSLKQHAALAAASEALLKLPNILTFQAQRLPWCRNGSTVKRIAEMSPDHWSEFEEYSYKRVRGRSDL